MDQKAEGDWAAANLLFRARRTMNYDAQQCAEKYLKARLEEAGITAGKTHDLVKLLSLILPAEPSWSVLRQELIVLTDFAVDYRYPGSSATKADAKDAVQRCTKVRVVIRRSFGLKG
jgi:HEPN domain-containing protein